MAYGKLLVVEDENKITEMISRIAAETGFTMHSLEKSEDFARVFDELQPDVIILDTMMSNRDGFEVLDFLNNRNSDVHVIVLSGENLYRLMTDSLTSGIRIKVLANVPKPFPITELRDLLRGIGKSLLTAA